MLYGMLQRLPRMYSYVNLLITKFSRFCILTYKRTKLVKLEKPRRYSVNYPLIPVSEARASVRDASIWNLIPDLKRKNYKDECRNMPCRPCIFSSGWLNLGSSYSSVYCGPEMEMSITHVEIPRFINYSFQVNAVDFDWNPISSQRHKKCALIFTVIDLLLPSFQLSIVIFRPRCEPLCEPGANQQTAK